MREQWEGSNGELMDVDEDVSELDETCKIEVSSLHEKDDGGSLDWYVSARNFYGFKFRLLTKSRFPQSLILWAIETPHLHFSVHSLLHTRQKDRTSKMDFGSRLVVQNKKENYWGPP